MKNTKLILSALYNILCIILYIFFSCSCIIGLFTYDKVSDMPTGCFASLIIVGSSIGLNIHNILFKK